MAPRKTTYTTLSQPDNVLRRVVLEPSWPVKPSLAHEVGLLGISLLHHDITLD